MKLLASIPHSAFRIPHSAFRIPHFPIPHFPIPLNYCRLLVLLLFLLSAGCASFRPTLHAAFTPTVPLPNGFVEKIPWEHAPALTLSAYRGSGPLADERKIQVKACTDGRAISLLVRWVDTHEAILGRFWSWNDQHEVYDLLNYPIDKCAVLLPISPKPSFELWDGKPAVYDVWEWRAGWDITGYAFDRRLMVRHHPWGTLPGQVKGNLYPLSKRRGMIELEWIDDAGTPGAIPMPQPVTRLKHRIEAILPGEARGSVADVRAQGVYTPKVHRNPDNQEVWSYHPEGDDWFVEFYRPLVTASKEGDDCQLRGAGPFDIAIAIWDDAGGEDFYLTKPFRLVLDNGK